MPVLQPFAEDTVFNSFGALAVAAGIYGASGAVLNRYLANMMGILLAVVFYKICDGIIHRKKCVGVSH